MKKKILAALMVSVAVLTAAGCSGGSQASSEPVEIQSVDDLADLKIGVQIGTTGDLPGHRGSQGRFTGKPF